MNSTANKYWHWFVLHPSLADHYIEALHLYIAALTIQRRGGESVEDFLRRRPALRGRVNDCMAVIRKIEAKMGLS